MSHFNPGLISAYNSLTDKHLTGYFSSTRIRRHLQRVGLITRSGRIVPDSEYKHKILQKAHQRHVRECLAQAIFLKVLEMERLHQMEIKRKLEEFARRERVHKMKVARTKRFEDDVQIMSPRPPMGARAVRKQHSGPVGGHYGSSESPCSSRPNTAPGKMQRPVRLKPMHSGNNKRSSPHRVNEAFSDNHPPFNCIIDRESRRHDPTAWDPPPVSPYCLPVINNFVTPLPPATKKKVSGPNCAPGGPPSLRGRRRLRPATTFSAANEHLRRTSVPQSKVPVTMMYFGKSVHLSHDSEDLRDEVKVFQQHCGGENLCVYKGKLSEGETFQFVSRRHRGFPFSLTFFLNGLQVERLSSCCEFKHRRGPRLGGRHGHFGFSAVERASPCYKCIIAMGLDKKPAPPPKKVQDAGASLKEAGSTSHSGRESTSPQQDDTHRDNYDEDFEGDDDIAVEESNEKKASSPTSGTDAQTKDETSSGSDYDNTDEEDDTRPRSSSSSCEESVVEVVKDSREDEEAEEFKEILQEESVDDKDQVNPEESTVTELSTNVFDTGEKEQSQEASGAKTEGQETEDESRSEDPERAKSVQEKLAEVILKESQCSSEPELSDTSTVEEEVASTDQGQKPKKDEAVLVESKLGEASETKEHAEAGQEEPHVNSDDTKYEMAVKAMQQEEFKEAKDGGDSEEKMKEGDWTLESQDNASAIATDKTLADADLEVKPDSETTEETPELSELEATLEDSSGLLKATVSREDNVKDKGSGVQEEDEASREIEATSEGRDDPLAKCEEHSKKEEEKTNSHEKLSDANEQSEKDGSQPEESHRTIENTAEEATDEIQINKGAMVTLNEEDEADESEKNETDKGESLNVNVTEAEEVNEEKAHDVNETNADNGENAIEKDKKEIEEITDMTNKDRVIITAQREEGEEINKSANDNKEESEIEESKDVPDKDDEEKIVTAEAEESEEINQATTDKEESKAMENVENEAEEIEDLTNKDDKEKSVTSEVKEGEEPDKATTSKEEIEAIEDENIAEESKDEIDKDEEQKRADAQTKEGEEISKATTDKKENEVIERDKREDGGKDVTNQDNFFFTLYTNDGEEIKKATTDIMEESEKKHKDENEAEESKDGTGKDEDKEIITAESEIGDQKNKSTINNTEESEHEDENKAKKDTNTIAQLEEENIVTSDTEESQAKSKIVQEPEKTSDEHLRNEDQNIVTRNVAVFQVANAISMTEETIADKVRKIENSQRSKVDAENGEMSTQAECISNKNKSDDNTSEQTEKGQQPDEESAEHKGLEAKTEITGDVHKVEGASEIECVKNDLETVPSRLDLIEELDPDDPKRNKQDLEVEKNKETPENDSDPSSIVGAGAENSSKLPSLNAVSKTRWPEAEAGTEEASKASEEGASVLLQTQSNTQSLNQHPHGESPEALARASSAELVTNWLTTHQASKFFETFVEPLEDLKESDAGASKEASQSSELLKIVQTSHEEVAPKHMEVGNTKGEVQSYPERNPVKDDWELSNEEVEYDVKQLRRNTKNEPKFMEKDKSKESLVEDKAESTHGWRAASMSGIKPETAAQIVENGSHLGVEPTSTEGMNGSPENGMHTAHEEIEERTSPEGTMQEECQEVTPVRHFIRSSSDVGSHGTDEDKPSVNRSMRPMDDIVSDDHLSVLSANKMPFAPSSYSLLASARTESGH